MFIHIIQFHYSHTWLKYFQIRVPAVDIQPPVVHRCPSDIKEFSSLRFLNISWTGPNFTDPFHHDVDVTTNFPENGSAFFWGDYTAIYTALKPYNGLRSVCTFNISVRRK